MAVSTVGTTCTTRTPPPPRPSREQERLIRARMHDGTRTRSNNKIVVCANLARFDHYKSAISRVCALVQKDRENVERWLILLMVDIVFQNIIIGNNAANTAAALSNWMFSSERKEH